jgi:hypothetical protein
MNPDVLFRAANNIALLGWLLLIFLPRWRWAARLICSVVIPGLIATLYTFLVITQFGHGGGFSSLSSVALLFQNRSMLLAGWVHYLAFDLFIGSWQVRDAQRIGISHYLVVPCLILTFLFGPAGWLLYFVIRSVATRSIGLNHEPDEETTHFGPTTEICDARSATWKMIDPFPPLNGLSECSDRSRSGIATCRVFKSASALKNSQC